jgi:hypothetical protein
MVQPGKFALNMWNSYEHFNLMDCIASHGSDNYKVDVAVVDLVTAVLAIQWESFCFNCRIVHLINYR